MSPLQRWQAEVQWILEWAVFMAQGGLDGYRRGKS